MFINSTNNYQNLEVLTCSNKAYLYTFNTSWKNGAVTSKRHQKNFRYYGQDINRYIDIDESTGKGVTNDGIKYKHMRAAGFYNSLLGSQTPSQIVQVLDSDSFTHVKVIGNASYFLFSQNC